MGLILDSSVLIAGERRNHSVREILFELKLKHGETDIGLSVVSILELIHGIYRAATERHCALRRAFTESVARDIVIDPITLEIAKRAGRIEGEQMARGVSIAFQDLLIGSTALEFDWAVVTLNVRHFEKIPGLNVLSPLS